MTHQIVMKETNDIVIAGWELAQLNYAELWRILLLRAAPAMTEYAPKLMVEDRSNFNPFF